MEVIDGAGVRPTISAPRPLDHFGAVCPELNDVAGNDVAFLRLHDLPLALELRRQPDIVVV
jgi:hypothetical protein